ncbi:MAG: hypothetical protein KDD66_03275 [Bdellovibrionales bacterium]|nr:hypothetical protein [Bdellovibrionales bacterium]
MTKKTSQQDFPPLPPTWSCGACGHYETCSSQDFHDGGRVCAECYAIVNPPPGTSLAEAVKALYGEYKFVLARRASLDEEQVEEARRKAELPPGEDPAELAEWTVGLVKRLQDEIDNPKYWYCTSPSGNYYLSLVLCWLSSPESMRG